MRQGMRLLFIFTVWAAIGSICLPAPAEKVCKVADPTGTPLNLRRSPNGPNLFTRLRDGKKVYRTLSNGTRVYIQETAKDDRGRPWVKVGGYSQGKFVLWGWVFREFISCYDR